MKYPSFFEEKKLWKEGYKGVVGLDEAGRGALAGPVVAAAVLFKKSKLQIPNYKQNSIIKIQNLKQKRFDYLKIGILGFRSLNLRDSKKLSRKQREKIYQILTRHPAIEWGIGRISEKMIDKINILEATKLAMQKALKNLEKKLCKFYNKNQTTIDYLILDGKMKIDTNILQKSIIKADEKVFSCTLAGIIAKVWRDRIMQREHQKYPQYGFDKHKGYPTKYHIKMLRKYSPSQIHRMSFMPVVKLKKMP